MKNRIEINVCNVRTLSDKLRDLFENMCKYAYLDRESNTACVNVSEHMDDLTDPLSCDSDVSALMYKLMGLCRQGAIEKKDVNSTDAIYTIDPSYALIPCRVAITPDMLYGIGNAPCIKNDWHAFIYDRDHKKVNVATTNYYFMIHPDHIKELCRHMTDPKNDKIMCEVQVINGSTENLRTTENHIDWVTVKNGKDEVNHIYYRINLFVVNDESSTEVDITDDMDLSDEEKKMLYTYAVTGGAYTHETHLSRKDFVAVLMHYYEVMYLNSLFSFDGGIRRNMIYNHYEDLKKRIGDGKIEQLEKDIADNTHYEEGYETHVFRFEKHPDVYVKVRSLIDRNDNRVQGYNGYCKWGDTAMIFVNGEVWNFNNL